MSVVTRCVGWTNQATIEAAYTFFIDFKKKNAKPGFGLQKTLLTAWGFGAQGLEPDLEPQWFLQQFSWIPKNPEFISLKVGIPTSRNLKPRCMHGLSSIETLWISKQKQTRAEPLRETSDQSKSKFFYSKKSICSHHTSRHLKWRQCRITIWLLVSLSMLTGCFFIRGHSI